MHNFSPRSLVLGDPLRLLPAQFRLVDVFLNVMLPCIFGISLTLRIPRQGLPFNIAVWLSECVAKPSPSSLRYVDLHLNLVGSLPEVLVANLSINKGLNPSQWGLVHSPCFCSIQQHRLDICVEQTDFCGFAD